MKDAIIRAHLQAAFVYSKLSHCKRRQVGCVIVKNDRIISIGYNGTLPGWDNACECEDNITLPHVIHAESNAITKLSRSHDSGEGSDVFLTCSPCLKCAMLLAQTKVNAVYYVEKYNGITDGISLLEQCKIKVKQITLNG